MELDLNAYLMLKIVGTQPLVAQLLVTIGWHQIAHDLRARYETCMLKSTESSTRLHSFLSTTAMSTTPPHLLFCVLGHVSGCMTGAVHPQLLNSLRLINSSHPLSRCILPLNLRLVSKYSYIRRSKGNSLCHSGVSNYPVSGVRMMKRLCTTGSTILVAWKYGICVYRK